MTYADAAYRASTRMQFADNLGDSAYDFQRAVWPVIGDRVGGGDVKHVESVASEGFARDLDTMAGIDAWQILSNGRGIRGIASRVQWGRPYRTFTVRRTTGNGGRTEYDKRLDAITSDRGLVYPHLTIHAYVTARRTGSLLAAAAVRTDELIRLCDESRVRTNRDDGSTFFWVPWSALSDIALVDHGMDDVA